MAHSDERSERRHHARVEMHVDLVYDSYSSFLAAAHGNLSRSGMFLSVAEPAPVGSVVSFEARLRGGGSLIRGEGQVVWVRGDGAPDGRPAGMAVRFLRLTPAGKQLIEELISRHRDAGGAVRLDGIRIATAVPSGDPGEQPVQPGLPWKEPSTVGRGDAPPPEQGRVESPARKRTPASPSAPPVRVTDKGGVEFDFSLIPDGDREMIRPRLGLDPDRKMMIVLVLVIALAGVLFIGPWRLLYMGKRIIGGMLYLARSVVASTTEPDAEEETTPTAVAEAEGRPSPSAQPETGPGDGEVQATGVVWRRDGTGIEVTVELSRPIAEDAVRSARMSGPDRHVIRLAGVTGYEGRPVFEVGGRELARIRVGLHRDRRPPELHIVLDLAKPGVDVEVQPIRGRSVTVRLRSREGT